MNTTSLYVELIVVGIQSFFWITLLVLGHTGYSWLIVFGDNLSDWTTLVSIVFLATFYTLGVLFDRVWDGLTSVFSPTDLVLKIPYVQRKLEFLKNDNAVMVTQLDGTLNKQQSYILSRIRIARSTFYCSILGTFASVYFCQQQLTWLGQNIQSNVLWTILIIGSIVISLSLISFSMLIATYDIRSNQISEAFSEKFIKTNIEQ